MRNLSSSVIALPGVDGVDGVATLTTGLGVVRVVVTGGAAVVMAVEVVGSVGSVAGTGSYLLGGIAG